MFFRIKAVYVVIVFLNISCIHASISDHSYEVEKGMVRYDIYGGGVLTNETNLTLKGKATLRFKDWGTTLLSEEEGVVITSGALKSKQKIESLEKQTKDAVYTVDFKNKKIHKRKNSVANALKEHNTEGLKKIGQENIVGLDCDIWEGLGVRKCLYKGIPLKIESEILGITYRKVATNILFDVNSSAEGCRLPDFPKENFALFNSALKTKNNMKAKCFTEVLKDVAYIVEKKVEKNGHRLGIGKQEKTLFLNKIGQKIFEYQKTLLPNLLRSMKETRACIQTGDNPFEANQCMEHFSRMKDKLGTGEDDYIILWDEKRKNKLLNKIEDEVIYLEARISCIKRANNITDLSKCMK